MIFKTAPPVPRLRRGDLRRTNPLSPLPRASLWEKGGLRLIRPIGLTVPYDKFKLLNYCDLHS
jgi:hypothetical protein